MTSNIKPVIALVPGAWHSPSHYQLLLNLFENSGYETKAIALPSVGSSDPKSVTASTDVEAIRRQLLLHLLDSGRDVVLLSHSYGGFVAAGSLEDLGLGQRKNGGSVVGFVALVGLPSKKDLTLMESLTEGKSTGYGPHVDSSEIETKGTMTVGTAQQTFFHDVPDDLATKAMAELLPHAHYSMQTKIYSDNFRNACFDGRRAFIYTLQDRAMPLDAVQKAVVARTEVSWIEREIESGHCPFLSKPEELSKMILALVRDWEVQ